MSVYRDRVSGDNDRIVSAEFDLLTEAKFERFSVRLAWEVLKLSVKVTVFVYKEGASSIRLFEAVDNVWFFV